MEIDPTDIPDYLHRSIKLLLDYPWIFRESNTKFVERGVLDHIPNSWSDAIAQLTNEEFNELPCGLVNHNALPEELTKLLRSAKDLRRPISCGNLKVPGAADGDLLQERIKGMSPKKSHEIIRLSEVIINQCGPDDVVLVDLGCGLVGP